MNILITAATNIELNLLNEQLECLNNTVIKDRNLIRLMVTGVGITATTYNLAKALQQKKYDLVVNMGIAGSFSDKYNIGDVVVIEREIFADWGVHTPNGFRTVFDENIVSAQTLPYNNKGELHCPHIGKHPFFTNLPKVKAITLNAASGEPIQIEALQHKFTPDVESMEGAAFFYVCLLENVPFIEVRSISNKVEKRDKNRWNIPLAIKSVSNIICQFINELA